MDITITKKRYTSQALLGSLILAIFALGLVCLHSWSGVYWSEEKDLFLAFSPYWIFSFLVVNSVYVGLFAATLAKGKRKNRWIWGISGFALTLLFILVLPGLLSNLIPYRGPEIFAGPAILAFLAPVFSLMIIMLLIFTRRKKTE